MNRLHLSVDEFRRLAAAVVDLSADYLERLETVRVFPDTSGDTTRALFDASIPEHGMGPAALDALATVLDHSRAPSPRMLGYVLGSGEPVAAVADLLTSVLNQNVTAWRSAPAAVTIERLVVGWLAQAIGCAGFTGSLTGGGSSANLMGLAMAREARAPANRDGARPAVIYASAEVHMSIAKAVALLGLGHQNLRLVATDDRFRMRPEALAQAIAQDRAQGKHPIAIVASAGTVNTGAIDPIGELAAIAAEHGLWLHVDGAYGLLAAMAAPHMFAGIDAADSLSLDAHKWLYQPLDCGCLLYRDPAAARAAFAHTGEYARSLTNDPVEGFCFFEESMELSRRFRGLKLWLSLRYHGLESFRRAIARDLAHARLLAERVSAAPGLELVAPVELSTVCFRAGLGQGVASIEAENRLNAAILGRVNARGRVYLSNASIKGRFALRACFVNHRTSEDDVALIVDEVLAARRDVEA